MNPPTKEASVEQQSLAKLLSRVDPTVHCDLCPSFHIEIVDQKLDVRIIVDEGEQRWYTSDEDVKAELRLKFDELGKNVGTAEELEEFKLSAAQALIQAAQSGRLFRSERVEDGEGAHGTEEQV